MGAILWESYSFRELTIRSVDILDGEPMKGHNLEATISGITLLGVAIFGGSTI